MVGGWNLKLTFCSMAKTHEPSYLDKQSLVQWKVADIHTSFVWIFIFLGEPFEYGDGGIFRLPRWMQTLPQPMCDHEISYADSSSYAGQLLIRPLLRETKNTKMASCWKLKWRTYCLMETTHEPLQVDKRNSLQWKIVDMPTSFIWAIVFFIGSFEYGDGRIFKLLRWIQNFHQ
jgi:hypothetical protein